MNIIAVDTGGTFTDLAAFDSGTRRVSFTKKLTQYADLTDGIIATIDKGRVDLHCDGIFKHGTTLAINALLERSESGIALVATEGFGDVLELARGNRPLPFDLFYRRDPPLVPRDLRFELRERMDARGQTVITPERADAAALADRLRQLGVRAVAVSFINAYLEPSHEQWVAAWLRELLPEVFVTCGTDLTREWYEYERTSTAAANAYVGPCITGYVRTLGTTLAGRGFPGSLYMMGSNGGAISTGRALAEPITLIESGPVGGCIGAAAYAEALGLRSVIALDMGGTTAKCALVEGGKFDVQPVYYVGGYDKGVPIRGSVLDIVEVSAGGGSIAWIDDAQRIHVGPRSAGSSPGPACYGLGGSEPTLTDANVVLGRLAPQSFLGGEMQLDPEAARRAVREHLALPLGAGADADVTRMAAGVVAIATVIMANAIKRVSVERGRDPRDFALFAYGGGGPMHAAELARELHIPEVIVPPEPGNFSAMGMLLADVRRDVTETFLRPLTDDVITEMHAVFGSLESSLGSELAREQGTDVRFERHVEMRYRGQVHSQLTPCRTVANAADLRRAFEELYLGRFGHIETRNAVELVSLRVAGYSSLPKPTLSQLWQGASGTAVERRERDVYFVNAAAAIATTVFQRRELPTGFTGYGPAVIEDYGSTTLVGPRDSFSVGTYGEIRIRVAVGGGGA